MTTFHRIVFPIAWIGLFLVGTTLLFLASDDPARGIHRVRWIFAAITLIGGGLLLRFALPLKHVEAGRASFFVSDGTREIQIPFVAVARVSGTRFVNPPRITLHLKTPSEFGERVVFLPPVRVFGGFKPHPLVKELEQLVGTAG